MVLFDRSVERTYLARSGLIGGDFPNHTTVFAASPGPRDLGTGNDVSITLTADKGGAKLAKTLADHMDEALLFRRLATLDLDAPTIDTVADLKWSGATSDLEAIAAKLDAPDLVTKAAKLAVGRS